MSQQGDRPSGRDDDWWGQLYDDAAPDTGPSSAPDTLDDRYASASNALQDPSPPQPPPTDTTPAPEPTTDAATPTPNPPKPPPGPPGPRADDTPPTAADPPRPTPEQPWPAEPSASPRPGGGTSAATFGPPPDPPAARTSEGRSEPPGPPAAHGPHGGNASADAASPPRPTPEQSGPSGPSASPRSDTFGPPRASSGPPEPPGRSAAPPDAAGPPHPPSAAPAPARPPEPAGSPATPERPAQPPAPRTPPTFTAPAPWAPPTRPGGPVTFPGGQGGGGYSDVDAEGGRGGASGSRGAASRAVDDGVPYVGDGPPTYEAEPTVLPAADPDDLGDLVADTVLDGARYGAGTLRAASVRGDSARYRGEPRRDALLTARFGSGEDALVLVAMATGARATPGAHRAAAEACDWIGRAVGRSHARLAEDIRAARRGDLKSGLHRLTDRSLGKLRAHAVDLGLEPDEYAASLRCLLLPADPACRTRVFFGVGAGGLFRLRDGEWQDIEPRVADATGEAVVGFGSPSPPRQAEESDRLTMELGITTPPSPYEPAPEPPRDPFRFRASVARPGDTLVLCSEGLAEPLRGEPELAEHLTRRWEKGGPPGLAAFLADIQVRVKGYADDRTAAAVWEA
ncbi:protein phosphatase 2C domain-containing protein [Streptomyces venezuelae]|uniref:protein phosphatase 2C domain-containing protein n=1 Tax=Streptomyces venezuelae TaxID=54571 RepID=UPI00364B610D